MSKSKPTPYEMEFCSNLVARMANVFDSFDWSDSGMAYTPQDTLRLLARDVLHTAEEGKRRIVRGKVDAREKRAYERELELAEERRMVGAA